jgi:hypothetical protein
MSKLKNGIGVLVLVVLFSLVAAAQSGSIGGPDLGFVPNDSGNSVWPVLGVPGASVLGARFDLASGISVTAIAPKHDYALAISAEDGQAAVVHLDVAHPFLSLLTDVAVPSKIASLSPTGNAAALYSAAGKKLQVFSGLPKAPALVFEFDAAALPGEIDQIAVSDDAQVALVSLESSESTNNGLWAVQASGSLRMSSTGRSVMTFLANSHDAVIAEDSSQEVSLLRNIDGDFTRQLLSALSGGEPRPFSAIAFGGTRKVLMTQRGSSAVTIFDFATGSLSALSCGCDPAGLFSLKGGLAFRLNSGSGGPMMVVDVSSDEYRVFLIPPETGVPSGSPIDAILNDRRHKQ